MFFICAPIFNIKVDKQMILGVAIILFSFPLRSITYRYFVGLGVGSFVSTMLFYSLIILGAALMFYSFIRWRVEKIRDERRKNERAYK